MDRIPTTFHDAPRAPDGLGALRPSSPTVPNCSSSISGSRQEQLPIAGAGAPCGPPPPPATYATFAEADEGIKAHALSNGYSLTVKEIWPRGADATTATRYTYRCGKGRTGPTSQADSTTHPSKRRKTSTQMTACPFRVSVKRQ